MASAADIGDSNTWALSNEPLLKRYNSKDTVDHDISIITQEASGSWSGVYGQSFKISVAFM